MKGWDSPKITKYIKMYRNMQKSRFKAWTVILFYGKMLTLSADSFNPKQIFYETKTIFIKAMI